MPSFSSPTDNASLHYIDYRPSPSLSTFRRTTNPSLDLSTSKCTLIFIHGWPMSSRMYEHLTLKLCESHGIRCVASDRRGFGKSEWTGSGSGEEITYDTFATDTIALIEHLAFTDDENYVFVAASMGCGETLLAYQAMSKALKAKCKGFIWLGPSCPLPLKTEAHPEGPPMELWDMIRSGFRADRVGFTNASMPGVFGMGEQFDIGVELPPSVLDRFERIVWEADALAVERCVGIITGRDLMGELKALGSEWGLRMLVVHGDNDQGMPASMSAKLIGKYVPQAEVKIYEKAAHGLYVTHADQLLSEIIGFVSGLY